MEEIVKHINDTNASYRNVGAGDAKNTDLFLDNEHYELFKDSGEQITVRFNKENLTKAILFIASILPRKYDNSAIHKQIPFSEAFVYDQLVFLDAFFTVDGVKVESRTQIWTARKDVLKKNGEIDNRFYFNDLLEDVSYTSFSGIAKSAKFTIRNYLAGGYSDLHIKKSENGVFDVWITNALEPYNDGKENGREVVDIDSKSQSLQQIYYGAPGTGKSHEINRLTEGEEVIRTTFHPDSDYSTFVGCYKPHMEEVDMTTVIGKELIVVKDESGQPKKERRIVYKYSCQAFLQAYIAAWQHPDRAQYLVIEEINRGNCAQIFGDIFQLLDRNDEGYSSYPIKTDADAENELRALFSKEWNLAEEKAKEIDDLYRKHYPDGITKSIKDGSILLLPSNLYIWATMNTSDQSLFPIDSAFKRRWDWKYVKIAEGRDSETKELLNWVVRFDFDEDNKPYTFECSWWQFILAINEKIANATSSDDKKLGYFFCKPKTQESKEIDAERFVGKVVFYLWNDVFKDEYNAIFKVVEGKGDPSFDTFYTEDDNGMTIADTKALRVFMHNVFGEQSELYTEKAKNSTDTEEMDSDEEIEDDDNNDILRSVAHRQLISVTFPDGTKYDISDGLTHFAVYKEAIRKIGVERAATIASNSKYHRKNHPVISKERFSDVEGDRYSYEQIGDYYLIKGMTNDTYINILNLCDSQLNLGLNIQYKQ